MYNLSMKIKNLNILAEEKLNNSADEAVKIIKNFSEYLPDAWQPYWQQLQSMPMLKFVIIACIGYILGKVIQFIIMRSVSQVTKRTRTKVDDQLIELLKRPIFLTVFYVFLIIATKSLDFSSGFKNNMVRILLSIIVLMWMTRGFKILRLLLQVLSDLRNKFKMIQRKTVPLFDLIGKK